MKKEPNTNKVKRLLEKEQRGVPNHGDVGVERMKLDAAAVRSKKRVGQ